jgi:hypothetical protein
MVRWIAFDDETAEAVVSKFKRGAAEIREGDAPLDAALALERPSLMILPSSNPGKVLLASVDPKTASAQPGVQKHALARPLPGLPLARREPRPLAQPNGPPRKWWHRRSA